jgi:hypothetical protein
LGSEVIVVEPYLCVMVTGKAPALAPPADRVAAVAEDPGSSSLPHADTATARARSKIIKNGLARSIRPP